MSHNNARILAAAGALVLWACVVHAQENGLKWTAAQNGAVPAGAVAYGHDADGRPQFVCRGSLDGGVQIGHLETGTSGCSVGSRRREATIASYEVLVQPVSATSDAARRPIEVNRSRLLTDRAAIEATRAPTKVTVPSMGTVPATPPDATTKRGFDDNGRPYVEVRLPDGTIKRTQDNGVTLTKPDGTSQFIPKQTLYSNVQPPTPPSLPSDPAQGLYWVERHNDALLDLIKDLVDRDDNEMKKFSDGESQSAGSDPFKQIAYRTKVADFLALGK